MEKQLSLKAQELKKLLDKGRIEFIFDLRNRDEFEAWRIEGHTDIETINIPQIDFVGEEEKYFSRLPKDKKIVTICAHGDSSRYTAELLGKAGFDAVSLEGGMDLWSEYYETHKVHGAPFIYQVCRVAKGCLTHMIVSEGKAAVIDAARHADQLVALSDSLNAKITLVLDTHLHADHISGGRKLATMTGASYFINPLDVEGVSYDYIPLKGGERLSLGNTVIEVVHSPGHTPGSTSFLLDNKFLFTGDIIMKKGIGRPDLGHRVDQWAVLLYKTLFENFGHLPDDIVILPSHEASVREQDEEDIVKLTLGLARQDIGLFKMKDLAAFVSHIKSTLPENPERYQEIRKVNLGLTSPDEMKSKELEIGKNLCGMAQK